MDDRKLVAMAIDKQQAAFTQLLEKYRNALMSYIQSFVPGLEDAEDICQKSFTKAFLNIEKYNPQYAFSTWLYNIAQNEAIDHIRRDKRAIVPMPIEESETLEGPHGVSPEDQVIMDQGVATLTASILALPDIYRTVAEMRFIKDYSYEFIAKEINVPLGTVKTRINRARKMLEKVVGGSDND